MNRAAPFLLVCAALPLSLAAASATPRLGDAVVPTTESVTLRLDPGKAEYQGSARISLQVRSAAAQVRFHAEGQRLDRVVLSGPSGAIPAKLSRDGALATLSPSRPLAPGAYALAIDFTSPFEKRAVGLYRMEQAGLSYAFTQFEPADARRAFPCWDEPGFKIPWEITLQVPQALEALANTPIERQSTANGWKTLVFRRTRPLPSYLIALAVGPLESVPLPGLGVPGRVVVPRGQARLAGIATELSAPVLHALEAYFGSKYPYEKLDLVAVPEYWPGAMENPGAITFADNLLLLDPARATPGQRSVLAWVLAHELAHQWFGDLVTMKWWDDLWLNESFADWMGRKIAHQLYPEYHADLAAVRDIQGTMAQDARPAARPIREKDVSGERALNDVNTDYEKGRAVLGMFEGWIGPERFQQGVRAYLAAHADGSATAADLWGALSQAAGQDVGPALATFLDQPGLPLIEAEVLPGGKVRLAQRRFASAGASLPAQTWQVPVALKFSDGKAVHERTVLLTGAQMDVDLGSKVAWVFPEAGALGYYRFALPQPQLLAMARAAQGRLDAAERVAFIGDLSALLDGGLLHGDALLRALAPFAGDPEPQVLSAMLVALDHVKLAFVTPPLAGRFSGYVRALLRPALRRYGLAPRPGEDAPVTLVRPQLLHWLGEEGDDPEVLRFGDTMARAYLRDPAQVPPSLAGTVLRLAALRGDAALFDAYRAGFEHAQVPQDRNRYLGAMGAFRDPALRQRALAYALSGPLRANELFSIPFSLLDTAAGRDTIYSWLTANYATLAARIPPMFVAKLPHLAEGCEEERLAAAHGFFTAPDHRVEGTEGELAKAEEQTRECLSLRRREGGSVARFLAGG